MDTGIKTFDALEVKEAGEGKVTALISAYGIKDSDGDTVEPGDFDTFAADVNNGRTGGPIPIVFHHDHKNANAYVGEVVRADPNTEGTLADGTRVKGLGVDLQFDSDPYAAKVFNLVKTRRIKQWSYAWQALREKVGGTYRLRNLKLDEVAPVLRGANTSTLTLATKSAALAEADPEWLQAVADELAGVKTHVEGLVAAARTVELGEVLVKAFDLAHKVYPQGLTAGVTGELLENPSRFIDEHTTKGSVGTGTKAPALGQPIAPRGRAWDATAAESRVRTWAGAQNGPNAQYARAFLYVEGDGTLFGDYHLLFCDVINGELTVVPRAVFACANVVQGGRGASIDYADDVKPPIERLYRRMADQFDDDQIQPPWTKAAEFELKSSDPLLARVQLEKLVPVL